ncbi:MAG TPA: hypothetical protein HPP83_00505 [Candidatus Hydrogenedentes bacterium]|nr:hypothetical protein [Candidatus Hydrogenedentota bacterium]
MFGFGLTLAAVLLAGLGEGPDPQVLPTIPATVERIADNVHTSVTHGWNTNRLVKYQGVLYATARVDNPAATNKWKCSGEFFRREPGGPWTKFASTPDPPYLTLMAPDGCIWEVGPSQYDKAEVFRMTHPLDFSAFETVYCGTSTYMGAGMSPEGNFLIMCAETNDIEAFRPNAIISGFYEQATGKWYTSRLVTPEGRYGYIGILLNGTRALAVMQSAIRDPEANPEPPHYNWRHVRLAQCDDLTKGEWIQKGFLLPKYGFTAISDFIAGPDGNAYLVYRSRAGETFEEAERPGGEKTYIAQIKDDLTTEVYSVPFSNGPMNMFVDSKENLYLLGWEVGELHLWKVDPGEGFEPTKEYRLGGTDKLVRGKIRALHPERFGGEGDGDTAHVFWSHGVDESGEPPASGEPAHHAQLWHAQFNLPVED